MKSAIFTTKKVTCSFGWCCRCVSDLSDTMTYMADTVTF